MTTITAYVSRPTVFRLRQSFTDHGPHPTHIYKDWIWFIDRQNVYKYYRRCLKKTLGQAKRENFTSYF